MRRLGICLGLIVSAMVLASCGSSDSKKPAAKASASIILFNASPEVAEAGQTITLSWVTTNALELRLFADDEAIEVGDGELAEGSASYGFTKTTTFRLEVEGEDGLIAEEERVVRLLERHPASVVEFSAKPQRIPAGESATLYWKTTNAEKIRIVDGDGEPIDLRGASPTEGTFGVTPATTTTYRLLAEAADGNAEAEATITILEKVTASITATPPVINPGETSILDWSAGGATRVVIKRDGALLEDSEELEGSLEVSPSHTSTYSIEAEGEAGIAEAAADVAVQPRIDSFESPTLGQIRPGMLVDLSWTTAGATRLVLSNGEGFFLTITGADVAAGTRKAPVPASGQFTLLAVSGTLEATETFGFNLIDKPVILDLQMVTGPQTAGPDVPAEVVVRWDVVAARSLSLLAIPGGEISIAAKSPISDEVKVTIYGPTTFELTAENPADVVSKQVEAQVVDVPSIDRFQALPSRIAQGESTTIHWEVSAAERIEVERDGLPVGEVGPTDFSGSFGETLAADTDYRLRAFNSLGYEVVRELTVGIGSPLITSFGAARGWYPVGGDIELGWEVEGGTSLRLLGPDGSELHGTNDLAAISRGSYSVQAPSEVGRVSYELIVSNAAGEDRLEFQVEITDGPVIEAFEVSPERITAGGSLSFRWVVSTDASGGMPSLSLVDNLGKSYDLSGADPLEGSSSFEIATAGSYRFTLEASSPGTQGSKTEATALVVPRPELLLSRATPEFASNENEPVVLEWQTHNADRLELYPIGDDGALQGPAFFTTTSEAQSGTTIFEPTFVAPHVRFVLESDLGARVEEDLRIGVAPSTIVRFEAEPSDLFRGETTTLSWETARATSVELHTSPYIETDEPYIDLSVRPTATKMEFSPNPSITGLLQFPRGFSFPFDGAERTALRVANSGYLSFDLLEQNSYMFKVPIPNPNRSYLHLVPFVTGNADRTAHSGEIWWEFFQPEEDHPYLIVQFKNMSISQKNTAVLNFEVLLRADGSFDFRYGKMENPADQAGADGGEAVIGYQQKGGTEGLLLLHNEAYPGGLSHRTFHFPVLPKIIQVREISEPFLDISEAEDAVEWTSRTDYPQFFSLIEIDSLPEGFRFPFAGEDWQSLWVTKAGYIYFNENSGQVRTTNQRMGVGSSLLETEYLHMAPYWSNLVNNYLDEQGTIWTALREDEQGKFFVVQWKGFSRVDVAAHRNSNLNFQILLREDGTFEYRYGVMDGGTNYGNGDASHATIGFQEPNGVRGTTLYFNSGVPGGLSGKGWVFTPEPALPLSGALEFKPRGSVDYTLIARNATGYHEITRQVHAYSRIKLDLGTTPAQPRPHEAFTIDWASEGTIELTIDEKGGSRLFQKTGSTVDLRHGFFSFPEGLELGTHHFVVTAHGQLGPSLVREFEVAVYNPFSIDEFVPDSPRIRLGEETKLTWSTTNVSSLNLQTDRGDVIDISDLPKDNGAWAIQPAETTSYTLTATSEGRTTSKTVTVEVRTISIDEFEISGIDSAHNVARGIPVAVNWEASGGGAVYWSNETHNSGRPDEYFMYDVSEQSGFEDIEGTEGATRLTTLTANTSAANVQLPFPFGLYHDDKVTSMRVIAHGRVGFNTGDPATSTTSVRFPDPAQPAANNYSGHRYPRIGVFWDDLHPDGVGRVHTKHITNPSGPDAFVVQWKAMKINQSPVANRNGDLNFQLVLYEDQSFEMRYGKMSGSMDEDVPATEALALRALGSNASIGFRAGGADGDTSRDFLGQQVSFRSPAYNGGLENRSLRFVHSSQPLPASGSVKLAPLHSTDYEMCAVSETWRECETFRVVVPEPGHLMITEVQADPLGANPVQWFEVRNLTLDPIDLEGMTLVAGTRTVEIRSGKPLMLAPAGYGVFSSATSPSFDSLYVYGTELDLKEAGSIEIHSGDAVMAKAAWEPSWFSVRGTSLTLDTSMQRLGTVSVPDQASWCESTEMYDGENTGSPGSHGATCLSEYYDVDYLSDRPFIDIQEIGIRQPEMIGRFENQIMPLGNGFAFPFFDRVIFVDEMWGGSWGTVSFGPYLKAAVSAEDPRSLYDQVPGGTYAVSVSGMIAGAWSKASPRADGTTDFNSARLMVDGLEVFIVQWTRWSSFLNQYATPDLYGHSTHQIQIWENGDIVIAYGDLVGVRYNGSETTVGIVGINGALVLEYLFKKPLLTPHQSILYKKK